MKFNKHFYPYQKKILEVYDNELKKWDNKIHIVAPPWSWKTIIWIEILNRLFLEKKWVSIIFVPNTVLQKQWKDKIKEFFLEKNEDLEKIVSFDFENIKKINILTYQAISSQDKKTKKLSKKVLDYFSELKKIEVSSIVLDEAHHLTAYWSKVIFKLYVYLSTPEKWKDYSLSDELFFHLAYKKLQNDLKPYVVWLTATPPFDDVDYFSLDKNYIDLLWEVDYYIPTPAIVKSGKLAPYNDMVQFVSLPKDAYLKLQEKNNFFYNLIEQNKKDLEIFFKNYLENYDKNINEDRYLIWVLAFCNKILNLKTDKFNLENFNNLEFKNIVYSISLWIREFKKNNKNIFEEFKNILYEIWYVWKKSKFVKYYSYLDKLEIYNPEKINAVKNIINKEIDNLWDDLRLVIITDFFEDIDWLLDCKFILKNLLEYETLNPILVSGQWIFNLNQEIKNKNILEITKEFEKWKTKILIWTRWILWEWWDSPKVNVLIDLTWISSFMSVNQVRWRSIRLDKQNHKKVANIYDIVTFSKDNILYKDFERLEKKHNQVYWVDDSWLIIKWISHIFDKNILEKLSIDDFNKYMLYRSSKRKYFYDLWQIWKDFENKDQFILELNINPYFKYFPIWVWFFPFIYRKFFKPKSFALIEVWKKTYYDKILVKYIDKFLKTAKYILIKKEILSPNFSYKIIIDYAWKYKIIWWKNVNEFEIKKFIEIVSEIFSPVYNQRYFYEDIIFSFNDSKKIKYNFPLPSQLSWNSETRKLFFRKFNNKKFSSYWYYHKFKYILKNKKEYLWYTSFIQSKIDKIWI